MMKEDSLSSEWSSVEKSAKTDLPEDLEQNKSSMDVEEEDESHLPPGVRKQNRYNNSSSSSSEDEVEKPKEPLSSDSDSEKSDHKPSVQEASSTNNSSRRESKSERKRSSTSKDKEVPGKSRRSKSRSGSRSRSRSGSPRKRRKSSDRSRHSRSRSRDRRHKKDRRRRSHRSRSKDRRRSRDRHRHKRDHKRSRSRSRDRRDRHRDRKGSRRSRSRGRRSRSRSGERRRDRSHSRSGSPVGRVIKFGDKVIKPGASFGRPSSNFAKPLTFKEKMRQQLIKAMEDGTNATEALTNKDGVVMCTQTAGIHQHQHHQATQQQQQSQLGMAVPKKPPVPLMANLVTSTASLVSMTVTASEAAMQSMLAMQKEATEKTGVEIPKYYNPAAINPMKYAEQVQKRKLLWSKSKEKDVKSQWHATTLSGDHDDKSKEKFRKLMGIKEDETPGEEGGQSEEKQKQLFDQLDKEYQYARMATHTHRGIGLGFGSQAFQPPPMQQQPPAAQPQQPDPNT